MSTTTHHRPTHRRPGEPPRRAAGLTLVELLVGVAILAMVASVAMTSAGDQGSQLVEMAEIQVRDAVDRARVLARSTRTPHAVVFDPASNRFAVVDETGAIAVDPITRRDYVVGFTAPGQPRGVDIASANFGAAGVAAIFDAQGVPIAGGSLVIQSGAHARTLTLDPATGQLSGS